MRPISRSPASALAEHADCEVTNRDKPRLIAAHTAILTTCTDRFAAEKEAMMPRMWIRRTASGRNYCCKSLIHSCYPGRLYAAPGPSGDLPISAATKTINGILLGLSQENPDPSRQLAFLAVPNGTGDDYILRLDWIYQDEEIITSYDGNY
jgi:hypothetical protein